MPPRITHRDTIRKMVADHGRWWHEIELGSGIVTPGDDSNRLKLPVLDDLGLPADMTGLRALDIGCSDGYFSFELEKRGADVMAIDFVPPSYSGFETAKTILGSRVEYRMDSVYNLKPEQYGYFDVILFLGVLYHLRKPLAALDAIRSVMRPGAQLFVGTMLIDEYLLLPDGTVTSLNSMNPTLKDIPLWQAYPRDSLNGDFTNCFAPNMRALHVALEAAQFQVAADRIISMGGYARALAIVDDQTAKYQHLDTRLERTTFDPSVPYFLDEDDAVRTVTPRRDNIRSDEEPRQELPWWRRW